MSEEAKSFMLTATAAAVGSLVAIATYENILKGAMGAEEGEGES